MAGDTFADALAAASLSDPTNRSAEPRAQRVAAADPLFDPIGGFDRVDTDGAPIIVTRSAREGATALDAAARIAVTDLNSGGCTTAREAIIVGGESAVAPSVASELISVGYDEVFRIAGEDRYATAAAVATAIGTGAGTTATSCDDQRADDGDAVLGWYGNAVAEFRFTADTCRLLPRSVVLADGETGADALAAGWWTSYWQVPVLLTAPDGSLPASTRAALQTLPIDNVIVLGGTARIPESTVAEAGRLATASVGRIAGRDRYATSVSMARSFGGWFADDSGTGRSSIVCVAASSGQGADAVGWADALAAGPFCARLGARSRQPQRALAPVEGGFATAHLPDEVPPRPAVPVLLVPSGASSLPASVSTFLLESFDPELAWCSGTEPSTKCRQPGFAVVLGGPAVVRQDAELLVASSVSGSRYFDIGDLSPSTSSPWSTRLELAPVFDVDPGVEQVCWARGGVRAIRWLWAHPFDAPGTISRLRDLAQSDLYRSDADGRARSPGISAPLCVSLDAVNGPAVVEAASLSGAAVTPTGFPRDPAARTDLDGPIEADAPSSAGGAPSEQSADDAPGSVTSWTFSVLDPDVRVVSEAGTSTISTVTLDLDLKRGASTSAPTTFTGTLIVRTSSGTIEASVSGEAILGGGTWRLRGRADFVDLASHRAVGGFVSDVVTGGDGSSDDTVRLQLDGVRR